MTTDKTIPDDVERLIRKNRRVDRAKVEEALKAVRVVCGDRKASEPKVSPHPFGRRPRRLRPR